MKFAVNFSLLIGLSVTSLQVSSQIFTISYIDNDLLAPVSKTILLEAYKKIGIDLKFIAYPNLRALKIANNGEVDGELQRIGGLTSDYPNLIQVPQAIQKIAWHTFAKELAIEIMGWQSLTDFTIVMPTGSSYTKKMTSGMEVYYVDDQKSLFTMLNKGRAEVAVASITAGLSYLEKSENSSIKASYQPVGEKSLFHYLHVKHKNMVPKINQILQQMQAYGRINQIRRQYLSALRKD